MSSSNVNTHDTDLDGPCHYSESDYSASTSSPPLKKLKLELETPAEPTNCLIYIVEKKISSGHLSHLKGIAKKKGFSVANFIRFAVNLHDCDTWHNNIGDHWSKRCVFNQNQSFQPRCDPCCDDPALWTIDICTQVCVSLLPWLGYLLFSRYSVIPANADVIGLECKLWNHFRHKVRNKHVPYFLD